MQWQESDVVCQQGGDVKTAGDNFKKTSARYGDTARWEPSDKYNEGLCPEDADLYPEFAKRIDAWRSRNSEQQMNQFIAKYGTLNAAARAMIADKVA